MLQKKILSDIVSRLGISINKASAVSGGDISAAFQLHTNVGDLFLKVNQNSSAYDMFKAEAHGLKEISRTKCIRVPEVVNVGEVDGFAYLLMESIESKHPDSEDLKKLGEQLAKLHLIHHETFGLSNNNYIGSLYQYNCESDNWLDFYSEQRLLTQYNLAREKGYLVDHETPGIEALKNGCRPFFDEIEPSLLHGDLWSGNYLIASNGEPVLIDPATYYGHSEIDIAMSLLFGGFGSKFYESYFQRIPKKEGFNERIDLYQLYYLLVHLNLFGTSYKSSVMRITNTYFQL